jgi:hypothetical protein
MAVVQADIKSDLLALFDEMDSSPMSRSEYAEKWSALLAKHIKTADVPAGSVVIAVVGDSTGTMNPSPIGVE